MEAESEAYRNGWHAHRLGTNNDDDTNPYNEATQAYSYSQWLAGWCDRFGYVKRGENTEQQDQIW